MHHTLHVKQIKKKDKYIIYLCQCTINHTHIELKLNYIITRNLMKLMAFFKYFFINLYICLFVCLCVCLFVCLFVCLWVYILVHSFIHSFIHSFYIYFQYPTSQWSQLAPPPQRSTCQSPSLWARLINTLSSAIVQRTL